MEEDNILEMILEKETKEKTCYFEPRYGNEILLSHYKDKDQQK